MATQHAIVLFTDDFRVMDNPALYHAVMEKPHAISLVYPYDENYTGRPLGGAAKVFLHMTLYRFAEELWRLYQTPLQIIPRNTLENYIQNAQAQYTEVSVHWNESYTPAQIYWEHKFQSWCVLHNIQTKTHISKLLFPPTTIHRGLDANQQPIPFQVFTPFWKRCMVDYIAPPLLPAPSVVCMPNNSSSARSDTNTHDIQAIYASIDALHLLPPHTQGGWEKPILETWDTPIPDFYARTNEYLSVYLPDYPTKRDFPTEPKGSSQLSPYIRFGWVSPLYLYTRGKHIPKFTAELGWREFAYYTLHYNNTMTTQEIRPEFRNFPWGTPNQAFIQAWQQGKTGYALIDAGMRQLFQTGFIHNRVRMVAASFFIKDLLQNWRTGEEWFWDTLVDACPAVNPFSWQWVFGSGTDAAPYFRIFNPILQQEKFDAQGVYAARFLSLDDYCEPIVDHNAQKAKIMEKYEATRKNM
jgi:deoxyribodipyrimidine photo-lyase